jgi:hypothetical protein
MVLIDKSDFEKEKTTVTEKLALQSAADEARKAARAAREFAGLLDDYAKYLTQPMFRQRAAEVHVSALNKLNVVTEGLAASRRWVDESPMTPVAQPLPQDEVNPQTPAAEPSQSPQPRAFRVRKKPAAGKHEIC